MEFNDDFALPHPSRVDPRGDTSGVSATAVEQHVAAIAGIIAIDRDEFEIAALLREYVKEHLNPQPELYFVVNDQIAQRKIMSKKVFRDYLSLVLLV